MIYKDKEYLDLPLAEREEIIARFEERVSEGQRLNPPKKEMVKKAVHRKGDGHSPVRLKRLGFDIILKYGDALADLFCEFPDDFLAIVAYDLAIGYKNPKKGDSINAVKVQTEDATWTDEWGTVWGHSKSGVGATPVDHPLKDWGQLDEYIATQIPNPREEGRLDSAKRIIEKHGAYKYSYGVIHLMLFERLHCLREMGNLFVDFYTNEAEVRKLMDAIMEFDLEMIRYWAEIGADAVMYTDDWGTQTSLMISPPMWREFFKPYYKKIIDEAHSLNLDVVMHSCGNVMEVVDDLIEVGLDVLDPIQPEAMPIEEVARRFGGRISFSGAVDIQHLLCDGTPAQVKDSVRKTIDTLGTPFGGGFLVGPANIMTPDAPLENIRAFFEAAHET